MRKTWQTRDFEFCLSSREVLLHSDIRHLININQKGSKVGRSSQKRGKQMAKNRGKKLRGFLERKRLLVVPGVYDALTAKIGQYCGFSALYMTGYGTAASHGYPDFGLLTMSEMLENVRRITDSVDIPLIADADTGYGNAVNVYRTVREYERAGAAAIQLEDQTWPKRCGHMEGKRVIPREEMIAKIKAAVDARIYSETVLVIRTDAIATDGFEDALRRGEMYGEAGADILFIEAPNPEQMREIPSRMTIPCLYNMALPNDDIKIKDIEDMGYAMVIYPTMTLHAAIGGCLKMCNSLLEEGIYRGSKDMPFSFDQLNEFLGLDKYGELDRKFALKSDS